MVTVKVPGRRMSWWKMLVQAVSTPRWRRSWSTRPAKCTPEIQGGWGGGKRVSAFQPCSSAVEKPLTGIGTPYSVVMDGLFLLSQGGIIAISVNDQFMPQLF